MAVRVQEVELGMVGRAWARARSGEAAEAEAEAEAVATQRRWRRRRCHLSSRRSRWSSHAWWRGWATTHPARAPYVGASSASSTGATTAAAAARSGPSARAGTQAARWSGHAPNAASSQLLWLYATQSAPLQRRVVFKSPNLPTRTEPLLSIQSEQNHSVDPSRRARALACACALASATRQAK